MKASPIDIIDKSNFAAIVFPICRSKGPFELQIKLHYVGIPFLISDPISQVVAPVYVPGAAQAATPALPVFAPVPLPAPVPAPLSAPVQASALPANLPRDHEYPRATSKVKNHAGQILPEAVTDFSASNTKHVLVKFEDISVELTERDYAKLQRHISLRHHSPYVPAHELLDMMRNHTKSTKESPFNAPPYLLWLFVDLSDSSGDEDDDSVLNTGRSYESTIKVED
jgi:hypothetical protein